MTIEHNPAKPLRPKRPLPLRLILWIFVLWSVLGWLRFGRALAERELIISLVGPPLFGYLLLAGLIGGLFALPVIWGLIFRAPWTPIALPLAAAFYPVLYWFERLLLWQDPYAHRNWPLMVLLTLAWAGLVLWGLRAAHKRGFFTDKRDRERG